MLVDGRYEGGTFASNLRTCAENVRTMRASQGEVVGGEMGGESNEKQFRAESGDGP